MLVKDQTITRKGMNMPKLRWRDEEEVDLKYKKGKREETMYRKM